MNFPLVPAAGHHFRSKGVHLGWPGDGGSMPVKGQVVSAKNRLSVSKEKSTKNLKATKPASKPHIMRKFGGLAGRSVVVGTDCDEACCCCYF